MWPQLDLEPTNPKKLIHRQGALLLGASRWLALRTRGRQSAWYRRIWGRTCRYILLIALEHEVERRAFKERVLRGEVSHDMYLDVFQSEIGHAYFDEALELLPDTSAAAPLIEIGSRFVLDAASNQTDERYLGNSCLSEICNVTMEPLRSAHGSVGYMLNLDVPSLPGRIGGMHPATRLLYRMIALGRRRTLISIRLVRTSIPAPSVLALIEHLRQAN